MRKNGRKSIFLIINTELSRNNVQATRMWNLSKVLNNNGIQVKLIGKKSGWSDNINDKNVIAFGSAFDGCLLGGLLIEFKIIIFILEILRRREISHVILRGYDQSILALLLKLGGIKIIYDFHGYRYKEQEETGAIFRSRITKVFDLIMLYAADHIIAVSKGIAGQISKKYDKKLLILPNGVDSCIFETINGESKNDLFRKYGLSLNKKIIGFIGMWEPWMNIKDIIDASIYVKNIQILIVGSGYNFEDLRRSAEHNSVVIWTGRVDHAETIRLLKYMDICVTPYTKNTCYSDIPNIFQSRKNIEYIAAGKPIIMSNIKGREEFIEGENVLLYEPGNAHDLANQIQFLLNNDSIYKKMSENNLALSKEFSWERLIQNSGLLSIISH